MQFSFINTSIRGSPGRPLSGVRKYKKESTSCLRRFQVSVSGLSIPVFELIQRLQPVQLKKMLK